MQPPSWHLPLILRLEIMRCQQSPWQHPTRSLHSTDSANSHRRPTLAAQCWARGRRWRRWGHCDLSSPQPPGPGCYATLGMPSQDSLHTWAATPHLCICSWHPIPAISHGRASLPGGPGVGGGGNLRCVRTRGTRTTSPTWLLHRSLTPELSPLGEGRGFHPHQRG